MLTNIYRSLYPEYCVTLPISGIRVNYAPYTLQTERTLVMSADSGDIDQITNAAINTINDYIRTPGVRAEDLSRVDCEFLITQMRSVSTSEILEVELFNKHFGDQKTLVSIDLSNVKVEEFEGFTTEFDFEGYSIKFRLPRVGVYASLSALKESKLETELRMLAHCVEKLVINGEVFDKSNTTEDEIQEWICDMHRPDLNKIINDFYRKLPTFAIHLKGKIKSGEEIGLYVEGLDKIFSLIYTHRNFVALYTQMWSLSNLHGYGLRDLWSLVPWEFDVLLSMINDKIEKDNLDAKQNRMNQQAL